ncbi:hypothetical protein LOTGIDRAFT_140730 [Lottia gigantea]|uniref:PDZ domain-containing protein n=1 Tax=Lottia gigantea TaxID=225164 RepID=V4AZ78_LOTGI|nr:hypothetical protein LOTGIDRAFT_140730 [Lottia gigantea]ESP00421.1 hypothetical protein LOTGIDRAFT_140730 [Lottia gigantea]
MLLPSIIVKIKKDYFHGLALVDSFSGVWVSGWNLVDFPRLHDKFHIGDKILSVNNVPCQSSASYYKQIKHSDYSTVDIQLKRLPKARVFVMRRAAEGESIGIKREGGTAEILYVDPYGLAGRHGLPLKSHNMVDNNLCNWVITEINSQTLNLFFKDMEVKHRLGAVGKDITIVVQPSDLINDLKKQLKKLKNYKSYLIK